VCFQVKFPVALSEKPKKMLIGRDGVFQLAYTKQFSTTPPSPAASSSAGRRGSGRTWSTSPMFALASPPAVASSSHRRRQQKTTVGLLLRDCTVETIFFNIIGAPHTGGGGGIRKGDIIVAVDGEQVDKESVGVALTGNDIPGSRLRLEVLRESGEGAGRIEVMLTRMPTSGVLIDTRIRLLDMLFAAKQLDLVNEYDEALGVETELFERVCASNFYLLGLGSEAVGAQMDLLEMIQLLCAELQQSPAFRAETIAIADMGAKIEALQDQVAAGVALEEKMLADLDSITHERDQLAGADEKHQHQLAAMTTNNEHLLRDLQECASARIRLEGDMRAVDTFLAGFLAESEAYPATQTQMLGQVAQHHVLVLDIRQQESEQDLLCVKEYARSLQLALETQDAAKVAQDKHTEQIIQELNQARTLKSQILDELDKVERGFSEKIDALEFAAGVAARRAIEALDSLKARGQMLVEMRRGSSQQLHEHQAEQRAREEQHVKLKSLRLVNRLKRGSLVAATMTWMDNAWESKRQRTVMKGVALRMRHAGMIAAFQRWVENIKEKKAMMAKSTRAVLRWKLQAAVRCLEAWRELTAEEVRKRDLMGRIVARMQNRSLSFAMELWQQIVSAARQEQAEEERRQNIVSRVVRRMLNQAQAGAFERWSTNVSELARQRDIMDRILRRMLNAKMSAGQSKPMFA
jgi:hypothetical protein